MLWNVLSLFVYFISQCAIPTFGKHNPFMYAACTQDNKCIKQISEKKSTKCWDGTLADKVHKQGIKAHSTILLHLTQPFLHKYVAVTCANQCVTAIYLRKCRNVVECAFLVCALCQPVRHPYTWQISFLEIFYNFLFLLFLNYCSSQPVAPSTPNSLHL